MVERAFHFARDHGTRAQASKVMSTLRKWSSPVRHAVLKQVEREELEPTTTLPLPEHIPQAPFKAAHVVGPSVSHPALACMLLAFVEPGSCSFCLHSCMHTVYAQCPMCVHCACLLLLMQSGVCTPVQCNMCARCSLTCPWRCYPGNCPAEEHSEAGLRQGYRSAPQLANLQSWHLAGALCRAGCHEVAEDSWSVAPH